VLGLSMIKRAGRRERSRHWAKDGPSNLGCKRGWINTTLTLAGGEYTLEEDERGVRAGGGSCQQGRFGGSWGPRASLIECWGV